MQELLAATGNICHEEFCLVRRDTAILLKIAHKIEPLA
jgi:hypothetical protein